MLAHAAVCKCVVYCSIIQDTVTYDYAKNAINKCITFSDNPDMIYGTCQNIDFLRFLLNKFSIVGLFLSQL